ncbi:MAG: calcium-translocating P-type ATPase, PMCA-type [Clostridia bacterium]|nr:calcium-translocating P-type ATPase, PMCA-type [Clostridia bacterium]
MIWHSTTAADALDKYKTDSKVGVTSSKAAERIEKYGKNILIEKEKKTFFVRFLEQLKDFMVIVLLIAAAVSFFASLLSGEKDWFEPIIIIAIVIGNALLGVYQESKAENALEALKSMTAPSAKVLRDGAVQTIKASELVPGDIIMLEAGDYIPADARLLETSLFHCDESALTGESVPVEKDANAIVDDIVALGDRINMIYSGCSVTNGHATAMVTETGMNTEVGKIAHLLENENEGTTPLKAKLAALGKTLGLVTLIICAIVFVIGIIGNFRSPEPFATMILNMFMTSVSLAVAAIPEGLPAIVTVVLALGVQRMVKNNAIVKSLPAVETLGSASVICSDKTGTLTLNQMTVTKVYDGDNIIDLEQNEVSEKARALIRLGSICTDVLVEHNGSRRSDIGDPTEIAIANCCEKYLNLPKSEIDSRFPRTCDIPFDSERKLMTTVNVIDGKPYAIVKGAPEILLEKCSNGNIEAALKANTALAEDALRVIAVAIKPLVELPSNPTSEELENDLSFVGLIGMIDPPRPEAVKAVSLCKKAGIKTVMITGDHIITAKAIATKIGIFENDDLAITGAELSKLSDEELFNNIEKYSVFARVTPEDKIRIVKAWQSKGKIVSMTGDGVNDAPALKAADIGCAMGITGTDVAKGAADIILTDDNFATIVTAVEEGRGIFANIRRTVQFLISCNLGEIVTVLFGMIIFGVSPFTAISLLWINLVTDTAPAICLGMEPVQSDVMDHPPRDKNESIFNKALLIKAIVQGALFALSALISFAIGKTVGAEHGATMAFITMALSQVFYVLSVRSDKLIHASNLKSNKFVWLAIAFSLIMTMFVAATPLNAFFALTTISFTQWCGALALSLIPTIGAEIYKFIDSKTNNK